MNATKTYADPLAEYVEKYATNINEQDETAEKESDDELSEVEDYNSDEDEPAGAMDDV